MEDQKKDGHTNSGISSGTVSHTYGTAFPNKELTLQMVKDSFILFSGNACHKLLS